jgi:WD40 repeat protein
MVDAGKHFYAVRSGLLLMFSFQAKSSASSLFALVNDCERFVLKFFDVMEESAMHIYHSALPWTPTSSVVRRLYRGDLMVEAKLVNAVDDAWNAWIREIRVNGEPRAIMYSPTGALIAVLAGDRMLLFDSMTGVERTSFDAFGRVYSIDFSPDDSLVMLARFHSICVWDVQTGNIVQEFTDVGDVAAFSPCGTMIASPHGETIRILNVTSGRTNYVLAANALSVSAICWSINGDQVITGSWDGTVRAWEVSEGAVSKILFRHTKPVTAVASSKSHDSFLVASASKDNTVKVCDLRSGDVIQTFSSDHRIDSVRFSIDGEKCMYASNKRGYIWDLARKTHVSTIYYDGDIPSFSPDTTCLASSCGTGLKI